METASLQNTANNFSKDNLLQYKITEALLQKVNGIGKAYTLYPWFGDPEEAQKYLKQKGMVEKML